MIHRFLYDRVLKANPILVLFPIFIALTLASLFSGVGPVSINSLFSESQTAIAVKLLVVSRVPRTLAVILTGAAIGVASLIMQMLFRNRFVEPTTAGTAEAASLGLVVVLLFAPEFPPLAKMIIAACFALVATLLFLRLVARIPAQSSPIVPLAGLMLGGVINAATIFLAYRFDLLQSLGAWTNGDFSGVLRGRYELLWCGFALACLAYLAADRFTIAGLGEAFTTNLGLSYRRIVCFGLIIISLVCATAVVTVGTVPFLGLIVANIASMAAGDNLRRALPLTAICGAIFLLTCDVGGRLIRYPYEIPVGTMVGVFGSIIFLAILLKRRGQS